MDDHDCWQPKGIPCGTWALRSYCPEISIYNRVTSFSSVFPRRPLVRPRKVQCNKDTHSWDKFPIVSVADMGRYCNYSATSAWAHSTQMIRKNNHRQPGNECTHRAIFDCWQSWAFHDRIMCISFGVATAVSVVGIAFALAEGYLRSAVILGLGPVVWGIYLLNKGRLISRHGRSANKMADSKWS